MRTSRDTQPSDRPETNVIYSFNYVYTPSNRELPSKNNIIYLSNEAYAYLIKNNPKFPEVLLTQILCTFMKVSTKAIELDLASLGRGCSFYIPLICQEAYQEGNQIAYQTKLLVIDSESKTSVSGTCANSNQNSRLTSANLRLDPVKENNSSEAEILEKMKVSQEDISSLPEKCEKIRKETSQKYENLVKDLYLSGHRNFEQKPRLPIDEKYLEQEAKKLFISKKDGKRGNLLDLIEEQKKEIQTKLNNFKKNEAEYELLEKFPENLKESVPIVLKINELKADIKNLLGYVTQAKEKAEERITKLEELTKSVTQAISDEVEREKGKDILAGILYEAAAAYFNAKQKEISKLDKQIQAKARENLVTEINKHYKGFVICKPDDGTLSIDERIFDLKQDEIRSEVLALLGCKPDVALSSDDIDRLFYQASQRPAFKSQGADENELNQDMKLKLGDVLETKNGLPFTMVVSPTGFTWDERIKELNIDKFNERIQFDLNARPAPAIPVYEGEQTKFKKKLAVLIELLKGQVKQKERKRDQLMAEINQDEKRFQEIGKDFSNLREILFDWPELKLVQSQYTNDQSLIIIPKPVVYEAETELKKLTSQLQGLDGEISKVEMVKKDFSHLVEVYEKSVNSLKAHHFKSLQTKVNEAYSSEEDAYFNAAINTIAKLMEDLNYRIEELNNQIHAVPERPTLDYTRLLLKFLEELETLHKEVVQNKESLDELKSLNSYFIPQADIRAKEVSEAAQALPGQQINLSTKENIEKLFTDIEQLKTDLTTKLSIERLTELSMKYEDIKPPLQPDGRVEIPRVEEQVAAAVQPPKKAGFFQRLSAKFLVGGVGALLGGSIGGVIGAFFAPVTFGLSIPLLAAAGAGVGALFGGGIGIGAGAVADIAYKKPKFFQRHFGKFVGGGAGALGGCIGGAIGAFFAPFTFGLSIPVFAAIGAAVGVLVGGGIGIGAGAAADSARANKEQQQAPYPAAAEVFPEEQQPLLQADHAQVQEAQQQLLAAEQARVNAAVQYRLEQVHAKAVQARPKEEQDRLAAEEQASAKAEQDQLLKERARFKAEQARLLAEQQARAKAEQDRLLAEQQARAKAEQDRLLAEQQARAKAEQARLLAEEQARVKAEEDRLLAEQKIPRERGRSSPATPAESGVKLDMFKSLDFVGRFFTASKPKPAPETKPVPETKPADKSEIDSDFEKTLKEFEEAAKSLEEGLGPNKKK